MATGYEPNIEGAITVLVDLMTGNNFTMTRSPYETNFRGLTDAIIDLKEGFPTFAPLQIGFDATTFEAVSDGDALFIRTSDGKVGKASAADGTLENANVYIDASHDLPEDFESYKYCYTPDDGFTLYPKYVVSEVLEDTFDPLDYKEGEAYPPPSDNFGRTVTYQDGSKTIISSTGEVTEVEAP